MNLSRLKWIKVVTPPQNYPHYWAASPAEIAGYQEQIIHQNGLTIVPLGFKQQGGAEKLSSGDMMALTQHAKITHIVEIIDEQPYEKGGWFHRYVKIVWWKPEMDWHDLPHREDVLGFDVPIQQGIPYEFTAFQAFHERWDSQGGLNAFQEYLARQLSTLEKLT